MDEDKNPTEDSSSEENETQETSKVKETPLREISEEELKEILEQNRIWVESGREACQPADLSNSYLRGRDLRGKTLQGASLDHADLREALLNKTNLQEANLFDANLEKAICSSVNFQKAQLIRTNLQGAFLGEADFREAKLFVADLRGARVGKANLQKAGLLEANLQQTNLRDSDLQEANLSEANLTGADLTRAKLQGAILTEVKGLTEAHLHNANFEGATGLLGSEFARADVTGATLPKDIKEFKGLDTVAETSRNARKIFLAMLLGCLYSWLTIATTTDVRLITNTASSPLPIIQTEIPIAGFYWAAPFALLMLFVYLHFYLGMLWEGLAGLPAIFPDGKRLDERAYPWLLTGLVRRHFKKLKKGRSMLVKFKEWTTIFLTWWTVPLTLAAFWLRYLPRHHWPGTWWLIALLVASVFLGIIFYRAAAQILRGKKLPPLGWKTFWRDQRTYKVAIAPILPLLFLFVLSFGAIEGVRSNKEKNWTQLIEEVRKEQERSVKATEKVENDNQESGKSANANAKSYIKVLVPWVFEQLGYSPFANLEEVDVSIKPPNWTGSEEKAKEELALVKGARLRERDLRYAQAAFAFLAKADLQDAKLQGAYLGDANLQGADLISANLQEADLSSANLQGAYLLDANLQEADLRNTNLQGADLRWAEGLTKEQLDEARNWVLAFYSDDVLDMLNLPSNHNRNVCELLHEGGWELKRLPNFCEKFLPEEAPASDVEFHGS